MSYSPFTATGDGSTTAFTIAFESIDTADIKARINNVATTAFSVSGSTVTFTSAPPSGHSIKIFRDTDNQTIQADFQSGSALRAVDLNSNFTQLLYVTQESTDIADTATTDAANAVVTANAANATANTASTNATNAVSTANAADANATTALTNSRESDGSGGFTTAIAKATTALSTATSATTTANTANTNAAAAVVTADASAASATTAVNTANTASTSATSAVNTANTAATNASTALSTANTAATNATTALDNSRASDGSGGFNKAIDIANTSSATANTAATNASAAVSTANTASTNATTALNTANAASAAVSNAVLFTLIANVAAIPGSPSNNDYIEIGNSTGIESFSPLSSLPSGFVGATGLTVRLRYATSGSTWVFMSYFANDSETRYLTKNIPVVTGDSTNGSGQITLNCENNSHGIKLKGPPHSAGANYTLTLPTTVGASSNFLTTDGAGNLSWRGSDYLSSGNSVINTSNAGISLSAVNNGTILNLTGTGASITTPLTLSGNPTAANHAANKSYVDTEVAGIVDSAPGTLDTLNELAAALGDDANFSTTVTNSIATKLPLAGGTLTGDLAVVDASSTGIRSQSLNTQATDTNKALHVSNGNTTDTFNVSYKGQGYFAGEVRSENLFESSRTASSSGQMYFKGITNNVTKLSLFADGNGTFAGTVTANAFSGDGSALTNLPAAGVSLGLAIALG